MIITAWGNSVTSAVSAARKMRGTKFADSREVARSGGEDGLYRVHLSNGDVVEVTVKLRSCAGATLPIVGDE